MRNLSRWLAPLALMVVAATGCKKTETAASDTPKAGEPVPSATGGGDTPEPGPDPVAEPTPESPEPPEPTPTDPPPATPPTEPATTAAPQPFLKLANRACACKTSACAVKAQTEFQKAQSVVRLTEEAYRAVTRERARLDACVAKLAGEPADPGGGGSGGGGSGGGALPAQGKTCDAKDRCAKGLQCIKYYGIAGASGPQFRSCEIPCPGGKGCPSGQSCTTIADGPGEVCRPKS